MRRLIIAIAALAAFQTPALAQQGADEPDIVVTGDLRDVVREFVGEVSAASTSEDQLARWDRRICPGIVGLRNAERAQHVADRIAQRALDVGLRVGEPPCTPNVLVFFTTGAGQLAQELATEYRSFVGYHTEANSITLGHAALQEFVDTDRPVRWWHVSQTVSADGQVLAESQGSSGNNGIEGVEVLRTTNVGRLRRSTRQDFSRVIIIVDVGQVSGVPLDALADYVSMISLAQVSADAETSDIPSVLNLFAAREAGGALPTGLTDWDVAYLTALYDTTRNARDSRAQERDISRRMSEDLRSEPEPAPAN
jgi:hypothetical protein